MKKPTRFLTFFLAAVMLLSLISVSALAEDDEHICPSAAFEDIHTDDWFHEAVDFVVEKDIMHGMSDTEFAPNGHVTRAQMVTVLCNIVGEPDVTDLTEPFTDVSADDWFYESVLWAFGSGITSGIGDGLFAPDMEMDRQTMVTFLYNFAEYMGEDVTADVVKTAVFADASAISPWAVDAAAWAAGKGIVSGMETEDGLCFSPALPATRAQLATVIMNVLTVFDWSSDGPLLPDNLVQNGGFEENDGVTPPPWLAYTGTDKGWQDNQYVKLATQPVHSGNYSAEVSKQDASLTGKNPWIEYCASIEPGVKYVASVWAYIESLDGKDSGDANAVRIKVEQYTDGPGNFTADTAITESYLTSASYTETGKWIKIEQEFTSTMQSHGAAIFLRIYGMGKVYFDDFEIRSVSEPKYLVLETDDCIYYSDYAEKPEHGGSAVATTNPSVNNHGMSVSFRFLDGDTVLLSQSKKPVGSGVTFAYPLSLLSEKEHEYVVEATLYGKDNKTLAVEKAPIYKYDRSSYLNEDGTYLLDQNGDGTKEPFYPVFAYHAGNAKLEAHMPEAGINTVQITFTSMADIDARMAELESNGLMGLIDLYKGMKPAASPENIELNRQVIEKYKDNEHVLGWMVMDEPFSHGAYFDVIELLRESYVFIRSVDNVDPKPIYIMDNTNSTFAESKKYCDILATDPYPTTRGDPATFIADYVGELTQATAPSGRAAYSAVQAYNLGIWPTSDQLRSSIYQSFFAGADAVGYFSISDAMTVSGANIPLYDTDLWPAVTELANVDLAMAYDVFTTGVLPTYNEGREESYWYRSWWKDGKLYLVILNRSNTEAQDVSIELCSAAGSDHVGPFKASIVSGGVGDVSGDGVLNATVQPCAAQLWEIRTGDSYNEAAPKPIITETVEDVGGNLVNNGDFTAMMGSWNGYGEASTEERMGDSGYSIRLASDAAKIAADSKYKNPWIGQSTQVVTGKTYKLTAWVNVKALTDGCTVGLRTYNYDTQKYTNYDGIITSTTDGWVQIEKDVVAPAAKMGVYVRIVDEVGGSVCYVDNVSLTEVIDPNVVIPIVKNGSFEDIKLAKTWDAANKFHDKSFAKNWSVSGAWTNACVSVSDVTRGLDSVHSLKLVNDGAADSIMAAQKLELTAGVEYVFSAWVKAENLADGAGVSLSLEGYEQTAQTVTQVGDWVQLVKEFTANEEDGLTPILYLSVDGIGTCYFDDVIVKVKGQPDPGPGPGTDPEPVMINLVENGGFENDSRGWNRNTATSAIDTTTVLSGSKSMKVFNDGSKSQPWVSQTVAIEPGKEYEITVRFRCGTLAEGDGAQLRVRLRDANGGYLSNYIIDPTSPDTDDDWGTIRYSFTAPAETKDVLFYLRLKGANVVSECYFDEVTMYEITKNAGSASPKEADEAEEWVIPVSFDALAADAPHFGRIDHRRTDLAKN